MLDFLNSFVNANLLPDVSFQNALQLFRVIVIVPEGAASKVSCHTN
jgi:hypothetical protein